MNKQSIISRWLSLLLLMMLTGVGSSWAQMLSIADFSMAAGNTKEVTVSLTPNKSQKIYGIQADISVSEGLSLTNVASAQTGINVYKNASSTSLVQLSLSGAEIAAGEAIKLTVQAAKSFTGGTIKIENMRFTDDNTTGHELVIDGVTVANVIVEEAEQWVTLTFDAENSGAQGVAPAAQRVKAGDMVRIPANTSLYIEGKTLAGWFIGFDPETIYKPGDDFEVHEDMRIIPKFTDNTVSFADRTAEVTAIWDFQQQNGAVAQGIEGGKGIVVTQITIGNETIDFPLIIDATSGKYDNKSWPDWAQVNNGTKFMLPACKGTVFSTFSMSDNSETTFNGEKGTYADNVNTYNYNGSGNDMTINIQGGSYYRWLKAVYPVPSQDEPTEFVFRDFQMDLRDANGGILTADEAANSQTVSFGITVDENNTVTRVAADAANTAAVITGGTGNNHGLQSFSATVPVEGPVQITMSTCSWGGEVTVKNAEGETVATFTTKKGEKGSGCYKGNGMQDDNIISAKYVGDATTLTISGGAYVGFFAVQAIDASSVEVAYSLGNVECQGDIVPTGGTYANGDQYTIPAHNFTLYKEGYTLTGWTDGENTYATGETITLAGDLNLTPVFTQNEVTLADRTEPVTLKFDFQRNNGAPSVQWQNQDNLVWVAQAKVNGVTIDVPTHFSTNPGKFNNTNWGDWCQINNGTTFTIPSCKGAVVSVEAYYELSALTIDGQNDYTSAKTISYTIAGSAETVDVVFGSEGQYYRYIQVVLPVVESQGGESFDNKEGMIVWTVGNEEKGSVSPDIEAAISAATVSAGSELTVDLAKYFDTDMVKYTPANSNAGTVEGVMIEYRVKPKAGVTFKPTSVSYAAVKVGTDGATYSWSYVLDGTESTITQVDAATTLRNNGANSATAELNHNIEITADAVSEFAFRFYISNTANNKNICLGNININGIVNGTVQDVASYTLTATPSPAEGGSINIYPSGGTYDEGTTLKLTATKNFGYKFVNWTDATGTEVSTENVYTFDITKDETLTANFEAVETYELALTVDGTNDYMVTVSPEPTVIDDKWMYEAGTAVQLTANQYDGLVTFTNWSGGETSSSKLISMTENTQLTAQYAQADIIAGWDFYKAGNNGRKADFFAKDNDADALNLVNTASGETSGWLDKSTVGAGGYEGFKGAAVNWRSGDSDGDVGNWHWQTKVNAEAFSDINVQFQMLYNYNAYKTYNAEYSLDGENWTKFGSITMEGAKAVASFSEQLPAEANNQKDLYIRMLADKENSSVDGAASKNDGNTLAMFFVTGTPKIVDDGQAPVLVSTVPANNAEGVSATGRIVLTFDERIKLADNAKGMISVDNGAIGSWRIEPIASGKTISFEYKQLEYNTKYNFSMPGQYISDLTDNFMTGAISLSFTTMARPTVEKKLYDYVVENVDDLVAAIAAAQARTDKNTRYRIFIKNGQYTIPVDQTKLVAKAEGYEVPECITFINTDNVSFIGESRDGVIITNGIDPDATFAGQFGTTSKYDGIGNSDVFQLRGQGYYWQDLTVETGMEDATGRDLAIHDRGTKNIYKNVGLRGYQDTWTSNNDNGLYYFEDGYVRGRTDYMCGKGDIFWNRVELRQIYGGYAAVPSKPAKYGWIYKDCVINGEPGVASGKKYSAAQVDGNYTLGRPWGSGTPIALFIDTKMNVVPSAIGWNEMSGGYPARFAEYNSITSTGSQVDLSQRKKTFGDGHANNPILTAEEAFENSDMSRMYGDWEPTLATEQAPIVTNVTLSGNTLKWNGSDYALLYAICKDGAVVDFTTETEFDVSTIPAPATVRGQVAAASSYTVRAANEMGGLNEQSDGASIVDAISEMAPAAATADMPAYNTAGQRVSRTYKGIVIKNGKKVVSRQK